MRRVLAVAASCLLLVGCGAETPKSPQGVIPPQHEPTSGPDEAATAALASYTTGEAPQFSWGDKLFHFVAEDGSIVDRVEADVMEGPAGVVEREVEGVR